LIFITLFKCEKVYVSPVSASQEIKFVASCDGNLREFRMIIGDIYSGDQIVSVQSNIDDDLIFNHTNFIIVDKSKTRVNISMFLNEDGDVEGDVTSLTFSNDDTMVRILRSVDEFELISLRVAIVAI